MLKFIGIGSAFNTELGNTSAFIKDEETLILIDCGGTIFHRIKELDLLKNIKNLHIMITHTHPDHVGSLGDLIFYAHYILKIKPVIHYPDKDLLNTFLSCVGVSVTIFDLITELCFSINDFSFQYVSTTHSPSVNAFGIILENSKEKIYYSGDASDIPQDILSQLENGSLDRLYQDTCSYDFEGNPHLSLHKLVMLTTQVQRNKVYCIHRDENFDNKKAKNSGFNIPQVY